MNDTAIQVENLGKRYRIGKVEKRGERKSPLKKLVEPFRYLASTLRPPTDDEIVWALRDVSFEVKRGEVVGLIGHNGAGKSTLLKLLSRITEPTEGEANIYGRVASLLEVGTGFHPELTGRENVYLNGTILGMKKAEIDLKFDEIVDFSGIEQFIDTPVKRYSSGMQVRLAFAVAAHLDPEILLIDEVLAVGDASFQKKCLDKMKDVGEQGRTVLFVSHNMPAVTRLCQRAILFEEGRIVYEGASNQVVSNYLNAQLGTSAAREWPDPAKAPGGKVARLHGVRVRAEDGQISEAIDIRRPVYVELEFEVLTAGYKLLPHFHFFNEEGVRAISVVDLDPTWRGRSRPIGRYVSTVEIPGNFLSEGTLFADASVITLDPVTLEFYEPGAVAFQTVDSIDGDSARGDWAGALTSVVRPKFEWHTHYSPNGRELEREHLSHEKSYSS